MSGEELLAALINKEISPNRPREGSDPSNGPCNERESYQELKTMGVVRAVSAYKQVVLQIRFY